jgi:hypothetical protein
MVDAERGQGTFEPGGSPAAERSGETADRRVRAQQGVTKAVRVDLLACSDIHISFKARFDKP